MAYYIMVIKHLIILLFKSYKNIILLTLCIVSYIYQYNGRNVEKFKNNDIRKRYTLGRIIEVLPMAIIGFFLYFFQIIKIMENKRLNNIFLCILLIYFFRHYNIFLNIKGFAYQGIVGGIIAVLLFITFSLLPFNSIKNKKTLNILKIITNHTSSIYYHHLTIYYYCFNYFTAIKNRNAFGCIQIYFICYLIGLSGTYIFQNSVIVYLF